LIHRIGALFLAALLPAMTGCFLFGGDDKEGKKKDESLMDASAGGESGGTPAPGALPEIALDGGGPSPALPIAALGLSAITLISLIVHASRGRRHADPGW
jgi:hypothetical protein